MAPAEDNAVVLEAYKQVVAAFRGDKGVLQV
jgi:hypothetical protein